MPKSDRFHADTLAKYLKNKKIATMAELKAVLGTNVEMTVYRKLQQLGYRTSYSHRGKYYALASEIQFDDQGLWSWQSVGFSKYGTLLETVEAFVNKSEAGYSASELKHVLSIEVKEALLHLLKDNHIDREKRSGRYIYYSSDPGTQKKQKLFRSHRHFTSVAASGTDSSRGALSVDELQAAIIIFYSLLDEKQRRLYAGLESLKLGHGGDKKIAELLGLDPHTVSKGRKELMRREIDRQRIRRTGAGRKPVEKKSQNSSAGSKS
ncbi:hypothetical protein GWN42_31795 [candidate division KSB1 bacterium]|nr:hypothetical protein [candidate division KSB1 bacterium]